MKKFFKLIATTLACLISVTLIIPMTACVDPAEGSNVIKVVSLGGSPLASVTVSLYSGDDHVEDYVTDENGEVKVNLDGGKFSARLSNLPAGYKAESGYVLKPNQSNTISVASAIITDEEIPATKTYKTGDVIYDFTIAKAFRYDDDKKTVVEEREVKLSELFENGGEEKKAILINFFYESCNPCQLEMPPLTSAYRDYKDKMVVISLDPIDIEESKVLSFVANDTWTTPWHMAQDTNALVARFAPIKGYPTNIMIDRYGVICEKEEGSKTEKEYWTNLFERYTNDKYSQTIVQDDTVQVSKPKDYGVAFTDNPKEISDAINHTETNITFSAANNESYWPWKLSDDGNSIVSTNTGSTGFTRMSGTQAVIYLEVTFPENTALAFDYKLSGENNKDYLHVAVDPLGTRGHQLHEDTGAKDWRTGYAYVSLEAGKHTIAFSYTKTSADDVSATRGIDDSAMIRNLRFVSIDEFVANSEPMNVPYFAARNRSRNGYDIYETVEKGEDGFYRVSKYESSSGEKPMLYCSYQANVPFFFEPTYTASIASEYVAKSDMIFNGNDYTSLMKAYNTFAAKSQIKGLVPVTDELKDLLQDIYDDAYGANTNPNGWLQFCAFFVHYGDGESYGNIIKGVAPFTAYDAKETTGITDVNDLNEVEFSTLIMPRGYLFKFVPNKTGVYNVSSVDSLDDKGKPIKVGKDAEIYDGDDLYGSISYLEVSPINECGSDNFYRTTDSSSYINANFQMYQYMEAGHEYYISVAFSSVDNLGFINFRIDYTDKQHKDFLTTATAGVYYPNPQNPNNYFIPTYITPVYDAKNDRYYYDNDTVGNNLIYCDFTSLSRMFNNIPIENMIDHKLKPFDLSLEDENGKPIDSVTLYGETIECKDYTDTMRAYCAQAKAKDPNDELYGMLPVTAQLRKILMLSYYITAGSDAKFDEQNAWLKACWYYDYTDKTKPIPNNVLFMRNYV